jgi:uncharacterized membrane protein
MNVNMIFKLKISKIFLILTCLFLSSCLANVEEAIEENPIEDFCKTRSFSLHVKTIIDNNCIQCHGQGGNSPNLTTYNDASSNANSIKSEVVSRRMPQGSSLTNEEIQAIRCWVDEGALNN